MGVDNSGPTPSFRDYTLGELVGAVSQQSPAPGGGAVAAAVNALGAALAAMAARYAKDPQVVALAQRCDELADASLQLADADAAAYGALSALRDKKSHDAGPANAADAQTVLDEAVAVPLALTRIAWEIAELGLSIARSGSPHLRPDAHTAAVIGGAAAASAAGLVLQNLGPAPTDDRLATATDYATLAARHGDTARQKLFLDAVKEIR